MSQPEPGNAKPARRRLRFTLRALMFSPVILAIPLGVAVNRARRYDALVGRITRAGGFVHTRDYDFWIRHRRLGDAIEAICGTRYFQEYPTFVILNQRSTEEDLVEIGDLMPSVGHVQTRDTRVTERGLRALARIPSIKFLTLGGVSLGREERDALAGFARLQRLCINQGQLEGDLSFLRSMPELEGLDLGETDVSDAALVDLKYVPGLRTLSLSGTPVGDEGMVHLLGLSKLESLDLQDTRVGDQGAAVISQLGALDMLNLGRTAVGDEGFRALLRLPSGKCLLLPWTRVTDRGLALLASPPPELRCVVLHGTEVTDAGLESIDPAHGMRVSVRESKVTEEGKRRVKQTHPQLEYDHPAESYIPRVKPASRAGSAAAQPGTRLGAG